MHFPDGTKAKEISLTKVIRNNCIMNRQDNERGQRVLFPSPVSVPVLVLLPATLNVPAGELRVVNQSD